MRFSKWHALGNSYLLVERAELGSPLDAELAARLCDVRYGDRLRRRARGGRRRRAATAEIVIWNPDGSVAEFSGNGTRIAAPWLAERAGAERVTVSSRTDAATRRGFAATARSRWPSATVEVGEIETVERRGRADRADAPSRSATRTRSCARAAIAHELLRLGPLIETPDRFPERTNVQLVRVDGLHEVTALVWERGAGETSASGSSAVAVAAAAIANGWCESPVTVRMPGGELGSSSTPRTG